MSSRLIQAVHAGGPDLQDERRDGRLLNALITFQHRCRLLVVSMLCGRSRSGGCHSLGRSQAFLFSFPVLRPLLIHAVLVHAVQSCARFQVAGAAVRLSPF